MSENETTDQLDELDRALSPKPGGNRFNHVELRPSRPGFLSRAYVIRQHNGARGLDVMAWDVLGGAAPWPMTNVRNLALSQC